MNTDTVKKLVCFFFNQSEDETNILDWKFSSGTLTVKLESPDDGMVEIRTIEGSFSGYAKSSDPNNFDVIEP